LNFGLAHFFSKVGIYEAPNVFDRNALGKESRIFPGRSSWSVCVRRRDDRFER
jgi:hypothetical protein